MTGEGSSVIFVDLLTHDKYSLINDTAGNSS